MKLTKLNSYKLVNIKNLQKYYIDWDYKISGPQKRVKDFLYPYWRTHCVLEELIIPGSLLRCDLVNLTRSIVLEVSPLQHTKYNEFFHRSLSGFKESLKRDLAKGAWAERNGFTFVEIFDDDLKKGLSKAWFLEKYNITL